MAGGLERLMRSAPFAGILTIGALRLIGARAAEPITEVDISTRPPTDRLLHKTYRHRWRLERPAKKRGLTQP